MKPLRTVLALALAAVLIQPYVSPVLCATVDREMMSDPCVGAAMQDVTMDDRCEAIDCATVPAAPIATIAFMATIPPRTGGGVIDPLDAVLGSFSSPLTPPPRA